MKFGKNSIHLAEGILLMIVVVVVAIAYAASKS